MIDYAELEDCVRQLKQVKHDISVNTSERNQLLDKKHLLEIYIKECMVKLQEVIEE